MDVSSLILVTLGLLVLFKIINQLYDTYIFRKQLNKIPGPASFPLIGLTPKFMKFKKEEWWIWLRQTSFQYKDGLYRVWAGPEGIVHVRSPKYLEVILSSTVNIKKSRIYEYLKPWLGEGLVTSTGKKWFHDRKLITPAFHFNILDNFTPIMVEKSEILVKCIDKHLEKNPGKPMDIYPYVIKCVLHALCETAMGIDIKAQDEVESDYEKALHIFAEMLFYRIFRPWYRSNFLFYLTKEGKKYKSAVETMHQFTRGVINKRIEMRKIMQTKPDSNDADDDTYRHKRKAFLDLMLDVNENEKHPMTTEQMREQVETFMFAGHDTTGAAICWALFCLGNNLDHQERVHEELEDVFGSSKEPATASELTQLTYLERVMKESLRLYPSVPVISRTCQVPFTLGEYVIPKGTVLSLSPFMTHQDPEYWPNPTTFDPDRFLPENSKERHPFAYIPFSAGPRNCIGRKYAVMEEKIVLTAILRKWRVKSVNTIKEMIVYGNIILRSDNGFCLQFTPKSK